MRKGMAFVAIMGGMIGLFFLMRTTFLYYVERPIAVHVTTEGKKIEEQEELLKGIGFLHKNLNEFLNYGKSEKYTDGDWDHLHKWFAEQETTFQLLETKAEDEKMKSDVKRGYAMIKAGVDANNIQHVIFGHRIYHDLDIIVNGYTEEKNIWGYTEVGKGKHVKDLEGILKQIQQKG